MSAHIALLGDSILDNAAYTRGEPDVAGHLRALLPPPWRAALLAQDGAKMEDLAEQLRRIPEDASHLVVSVGGNDVLDSIDLLDRRVHSSREAYLLLGRRAAAFEETYRRAVAELLAAGRDSTLCTIYNGNLDPAQADVGRVALIPFNDVICRVGFESGLRIIDLRLVCTEPADYANPIEPSGRGGRKIALAIAQALGIVAGAECSTVFGGCAGVRGRGVARQPAGS